MRLRSRWLTLFLAMTATRIVRLLFRTCRTTIHELGSNTVPYDDKVKERHIYHVWHDMVLPAIFCGPQPNTAALVSRHTDGEYVVEMLRATGIVPIRGSSRRGGAAATRALLEQIERNHVVITPDGPRGPRRVAKHGILFLASESGRKIIPTGFACGWSIHPRGNWTDIMVPIPFTRIVAVLGEPVEVPSGLPDEEYDTWALHLERCCRHAEDQAHLILSGEQSGPMPTPYQVPASQHHESIAA